MCSWREFRGWLDENEWAKLPLSYAAFWPTVLFARVWAWCLPEQRRVWDEIPGTCLVVGAVPLLPWEFDALQDAGVCSIVNMCKEWAPDSASITSRGMGSLHLPVVDMTPPSQAQCWQAAHFIAANGSRAQGKKVYVHCKAGRGRSVIASLAFLAAYDGVSPAAGMASIRAARPHANDKSAHPAVQQFWEEAQAWRRSEEGAAAVAVWHEAER